jgi:hypothetical protein
VQESFGKNDSENHIAAAAQDKLNFDGVLINDSVCVDRSSPASVKKTMCLVMQTFPVMTRREEYPCGLDGIM